MAVRQIDPQTLMPSANDPYMVNPKGVEVRVRESVVPELLKKGYTLVDPQWRPTGYRDAGIRGQKPRPDAVFSRAKFEELPEEEEVDQVQAGLL